MYFSGCLSDEAPTSERDESFSLALFLIVLSTLIARGFFIPCLICVLAGLRTSFGRGHFAEVPLPTCQNLLLDRKIAHACTRYAYKSSSDCTCSRGFMYKGPPSQERERLSNTASSMFLDRRLLQPCALNYTSAALPPRFRFFAKEVTGFEFPRAGLDGFLFRRLQNIFESIILNCRASGMRT